MRANRLQELLARDELALTGWVSTGNALVAELLGHSGYDAVTVDLQHGMFGLDAAIACLQAVSATPAVPLARCRSNDLAEIGHLLDAGAYGIICPSIDTPDDAARFVAACRYPPRGRRSYGPTRAVLYGGPDYVAGADDTVLALGMVESASALDHLDAILAVDGLDAVYVGPSDLAVSNGWEVPGGGPLDTELADALVHIVTRAGAAGVPAGIFAQNLDHAVQCASWGYRLITPGSDVGLLRAAATERIAMLRRGSASANDDREV